MAEKSLRERKISAKEFKYTKGKLTARCNVGAGWQYATSDREDFSTRSTYSFRYGLTLLLNENFPARKPIAVGLHKGWNKVFLKLPYVNTPRVRLNKWLFTFVLTDLEGKHAIDGLIYSPQKKKQAARQSITNP